MVSIRGVVLIGGALAVLVVPMLAPGASPEAQKCRPRQTDSDGLPEIGLVVDGKLIVDADGLPARPTLDELSNYGIEKDEIDTIEVICWQEVETLYGVRVRTGALDITLKRPGGARHAGLATG